MVGEGGTAAGDGGTVVGDGATVDGREAPRWAIALG